MSAAWPALIVMWRSNTDVIGVRVRVRDRGSLDFLTPALLPPNTPVFRDMNAVGFAQELRPGR